MITTMPVFTLPATTSHLRLLESGLLVPATAGARTFVTERSRFHGHFDENFVSYGTDEPNEATTEVVSCLYETAGKSGNYQRQLGSFWIDPGLLFWRSQDQTLVWIEKYYRNFCVDDRETLIPFIVRGQRFIARIYGFGSEFSAIISRFYDCDLVWNAEYRTRWILPQLVSSP